MSIVECVERWSL